MIVIASINYVSGINPPKFWDLSYQSFSGHIDHSLRLDGMLGRHHSVLSRHQSFSISTWLTQSHFTEAICKTKNLILEFTCACACRLYKFSIRSQNYDSIISVLSLIIQIIYSCIKYISIDIKWNWINLCSVCTVEFHCDVHLGTRSAFAIEQTLQNLNQKPSITGQTY